LVSTNRVIDLYLYTIIIGTGFVDVSFSIDATFGIIRISGAIDPNKLLTEVTKAGKHAELIVADVVGGNGGSDSGCGHSHFHPNSNHGNEYNGQYRFNEGRRYNHNEYNGTHGNVIPSYNQIQYQSDPYREYNGGHGNVIPSYNHIQYQSDPYRSNGVLALPPPSTPEQLHHQQLQHYNDTNNNCIIM